MDDPQAEPAPASIDYVIMGALHIDSAACTYKGSLSKTTGGQWTCTGDDVEAILLDQIAGNINVATRNQWGASQ